MHQRQFFHGLRSASFLLLVTALCHTLGAADSAPVITIHVFDYSGMQRGAMAEAERLATATLSLASIEVLWRNCPVPGIAEGGGTCGAGTDDATHFVLGVLTERMAHKIAPKAQQFGLAVISPEATFPTNAYVCVDRIINLARGEMVSWPELLGVIIGHEVGHLLLRDNRHSPVGIMRAKWNSADIREALMGNLIFTPEQAAQIRSDVRRRAKSRE